MLIEDFAKLLLDLNQYKFDKFLNNFERSFVQFRVLLICAMENAQNTCAFIFSYILTDSVSNKW